MHAYLVREMDAGDRMGLKMIDIPPVWLVLAIALAWAQGTYADLGLSLAHPITDFLAGVLIGGGLILILLAAVEFRRARTSIIPHQDPNALITSGIFSRTRNPIYVADVLILAGFILRYDAVLSLILVPIFVWFIEKRFILAEEDRLRKAFRMDFARYEQKVRRWM